MKPENVMGTGINDNPSPQDAEQEKVPASVIIADTITAFFGSVRFLALSLFVFISWICFNTLLPFVYRFDPYPFQFLNLGVGIGAFLLSVFVLISQNRQAARDRLMVQQDYKTDQRAEADDKLILQIVGDMASSIEELRIRSRQQGDMLRSLAGEPIDERLFTLAEAMRDIEENMKKLYQEMKIEGEGDFYNV